MPRQRYVTESGDSDSSDGRDLKKSRSGRNAKHREESSPVKQSRRHDSTSSDSSPDTSRHRKHDSISSPPTDISPRKKPVKRKKEEKEAPKGSIKEKTRGIPASSRKQSAGSDISPEKKRHKLNDSFSPPGIRKDRQNISQERYNRRSSSFDRDPDSAMIRRGERLKEDRARKDSQRPHLSRSPDSGRGNSRAGRHQGRSPVRSVSRYDDRGDREGRGVRGDRGGERSASKTSNQRDQRNEGSWGRSSRDGDRRPRSPLSPVDIRGGGDRNFDNRGRSNRREGKRSIDKDTDTRSGYSLPSSSRNNGSDDRQKVSKDRNSGVVDMTERETSRSESKKRHQNDSFSDNPDWQKSGHDTENLPVLSKTKKKKSGKRHRSQSDSSGASSPSGPRKILAKKTKKSLKKKQVSVSPSSSLERDPMSPSLNRSRSLNNSGSSELGRKHDMARFESEPESGEITDSEEDKESKQVVKSFVNVAKLDGESGGDNERSPDRTRQHNSLDSDRHKVEDEQDRQRSTGRGGRGGQRDLSARGGERRYLGNREGGRRDAQTDNRGPRRDERRNRETREDADKRPRDDSTKPDVNEAPSQPERKAKEALTGVAALTGKTGGAYIPPAKLRAMQASITDKTSVEYQRISWEALKKSINGLVNKVNVSNIKDIVLEVFKENIVRGRGLLSRSIIQAQVASPIFTHVYAALVAVVNTKFPQIGELILKRLIQQFRRGFKRNDKAICLSAVKFIAHLVNFQVAHEVLALEVLTLLLDTPTNDSVELSVGFIKECGQKLTEVTPRGINAMFESLRNTLHEGSIDTRVQYMVEVLFAVRKDHFKDYPAVDPQLDLISEEDQFTHMISLEDVVNGEEMLNVFRPDPNFAESEEKYENLKRDILGDDSSDEKSGSDSSDDDDSDEDDSDAEEEGEKQTIIDQTETNMVALRRTIYLTIQSSLDFEECAHKLLKMELKPGQEVELCNMILDCCAQMRTYEKFFGLLAGRFCHIDKKYIEPFQQMFIEQYSTIHRLETNKLRNVAKFFAHLLHTDSISWGVLSCIKLNEEDTTSASRIFIKILFQELSEYMGLPKLNERLKDVTLQEYFVGILPKENPRDTRFAINFFTTIGLGGLTDDLRDHLKNVSKKLMQQKQEEQVLMESSSDASSSEVSDESESSDDSSSSSSSSESSEDERKKRKKKSKSPPKKKGKEKDQNKVKERKEKRNDAIDQPLKRKDRENGAVDKRSKKADRKNDKNERKKDKQRQREVDEEAQQKEREENFRRLARLANYGDIANVSLDQPADPPKSRKDKGEKKKKGSKNGPENKDKRRKERLDDVDDLRRGRDLDRGDRRGRDSLDHYDSGRDLDPYPGQPGLERTYDGRDSRGNARRGDDLDDDRPIKVERNFERLDMYEDKFERERRRNLEMVRDREEFGEYLYTRGRDLSGDRYNDQGGRGRNMSIERYDDRERLRGGPSPDRFDDRERGRGLMRERLGGGLDWDREPMGSRRGHRSAERVNIGRDDRKRRR